MYMLDQNKEVHIKFGTRKEIPKLRDVVNTGYGGFLFPWKKMFQVSGIILCHLARFNQAVHNCLSQRVLICY